VSYVLKNLTDRPVLLTLTTGEALRLSPGDSSPVLADVEIANNPKVEKLASQRVVAIEATRAAARASGRRAAGSADQDDEVEVRPRGQPTAEDRTGDEDKPATRSGRERTAPG